MDLNGSSSVTLGGVPILHTGPTTADQSNGSTIAVTAGGPLTAVDFSSTVALGAGRTLANGGTISLFGTGSYNATATDGRIEPFVDKFPPRIHGPGGDIKMHLNDAL